MIDRQQRFRLKDQLQIQLVCSPVNKGADYGSSIIIVILMKQQCTAGTPVGVSVLRDTSSIGGCRCRIGAQTSEFLAAA